MYTYLRISLVGVFCLVIIPLLLVCEVLKYDKRHEGSGEDSIRVCHLRLNARCEKHDVSRCRHSEKYELQENTSQDEVLFKHCRRLTICRVEIKKRFSKKNGTLPIFLLMISQR